MTTANRDLSNDAPLAPNDDAPRVNTVRAIRNNAWLVAVVLVGALVFAGIVTSLQERVYRASTSFVVVQPGDTLSRSVIADIALTQTVAGLAETDIVAAEVVERADLDTTPKKFLENLNVTVRPSASVVDVTFDDPDQEQAKRALTVMSQVFNDLVERDLVARRSTGTTTDNLLEIKTFSAPHVQPDAVSPKPARTLLFAGILGLIAGVLIALLRERLDDRIRDRRDAGAAFGAPVIGALPAGWELPPLSAKPRSRRSPAGSGRTGATRGKRRDDPEAQRELVDQAAQLLSLNVEALRSGTEGNAIVVTSTRRDEGKTSVVAHLGTALARNGMNVICVEVDANGPPLHRQLGVDAPSVGLLQVVRRDARVSEALVTVPVNAVAEDDPEIEARGGLRILTVGDTDVSLAALLSEDAISRLVQVLRAYADFVIFDASPIGFGEAHRLVRTTDTVIMVARRGNTRRRRAQTARAILDRLGARRTAVVLTDADADESVL